MRYTVILALVLAASVAAPASAATFFHSPSGNIRCVIDRTSLARCDISERNWSPPPKPQSCPGDWGNGMQVDLRGRGRFTCANDAVSGGRTLAYGRSIKRGRFRCRSRVSGMRCVNVRNGHGFALSKQRARRF